MAYLEVSQRCPGPPLGGSHLLLAHTPVCQVNFEADRLEGWFLGAGSDQNPGRGTNLQPSPLEGGKWDILLFVIYLDVTHCY